MLREMLHGVVADDEPRATNAIGRVGTVRRMHPDGRIYGKRVTDMTSRELGELGERMAAEYLEDKGMRVLERNWENPFGEVDIIALDEDGTHVLAEVKTRRVFGDGFEGLPESAVDRRKRHRYRRMGLFYLACTMLTESVRFDVIAVNVSPESTVIRHVVGAFAWEE